MTKPRRHLLSRAKGWRMPENTFNGARPGRLGNPFIVGRHGTVRDVVRKHFNLIFRDDPSPDGPPLAEQWAHYHYVHSNVQRFRGMNGACWCALGEGPCHVNNLLEFFNREAPNDPTDETVPPGTGEMA